MNLKGIIGFDDPEVNEKLFSLLERSLEQLHERHRQVIEDRFGLLGSTPKTLHESGRRLRLTRNRVRIIQQQALRNLFAKMINLHAFDSLEDT